MIAKIKSIEDIIEQAEICKSAWLWTPGANAATRRWNERKHSRPEVAWTEGGHDYTARFDYRETCSHVYASGCYTRDGVKTTLTAIRNSLRRMTAEVTA